jgi:hypothetical protein
MAFYVSFLVPMALLLICMVWMIVGELSLSLWLLLKGNKISGINPEDMKKMERKIKLSAIT